MFKIPFYRHYIIWVKIEQVLNIGGRMQIIMDDEREMNSNA